MQLAREGKGRQGWIRNNWGAPCPSPDLTSSHRQNADYVPAPFLCILYTSTHCIPITVRKAGLATTLLLQRENELGR